MVNFHEWKWIGHRDIWVTFAKIKEKFGRHVCTKMLRTMTKKLQQMPKILQNTI